MPINSVLAVLTVANFDAALAWYERFFARTADRRPMDGLAEWQVTDTASVQLVHDPDRAGSALLTLGVDDWTPSQPTTQTEAYSPERSRKA